MFRKIFTGTATAVLVASVLAGCGSTSDSGGSASTATVDPAYFSSVEKQVDELRAPQTTLPPADGPAAAPGKKIAIVTITLAEAAAKRITESLEQAVTDIGWTSTTYDGQGSATTANDKMQQAVTTKPDGIVLVALDRTTVGAGLEAAKAAGIPVSCNFCWDLDAEDTRGPFVDVQPALSRLSDMGKASAQYAFVATEGHPQFLTFNDPALSNLIARQDGFDEFLAECQSSGGDCSLVASKDFQVANATTTLAADAATLARANPDFNAIWASFDFAGLQVINGLRQAGIMPTDKSFLVSSNGDGENLKLISEGGYQKATVAISFDWASYASIDNLNRVFAGGQPVDQNVPIRLFDQSNAGDVDGGAWISDVDFRTAYTDTWKG